MFTGGYDYIAVHWKIDQGELVRKFTEQYSYITAIDAAKGFLYIASADNSLKKFPVDLSPVNATSTSLGTSTGSGTSSGVTGTNTPKNNALAQFKSTFLNTLSFILML